MNFDFHINLPCPHDGYAVREWINSNGIQYSYNTAEAGEYITYKFTSEEDAVFFVLRWAK